jgi:hypothetical protein
MRNALWAAALIAGFTTMANAQSLQLVNSVDRVDRIGKTFTTWRGSNTTFMVTDRTTFQVGTTPSSMAALKAGNDVAVTYHKEGQNSIADSVVINN